MRKYAVRQIDDERTNIATLMIILLVIALIFLPRACGAITADIAAARIVHAAGAGS
jgi:hypothetical protein